MPVRSGYRPGFPCWVDLLAPDLAAALRFYAPVLGWDADPAPGYQLVRIAGRADGVVGGLAAQPGGRSAWTTYLAAADVDAAAAAATLLGHRLLMPPTTVADGRIAVLLDPLGGTVGLFHGRHHTGVVLVDEPGASAGHLVLSADPALTAGAQTQLATAAGAAPIAVSGSDDDLQLTSGPDALRILRADVPVPQRVPLFGVSIPRETVDAAAHRGARVLRTADDITVLADPLGAVFGVTGVRVGAGVS